MSQRRIALTTLLVRDYDEAIAFYAGRLGFRIVEDTDVPEQDKRWVVLAPSKDPGMSLLLAEAATDEQRAAVGNQAPGRVFLFLHTDDFARDYDLYRAQGVEFLESPRHEPYGTVAVFKDLYGNRWDLLEPR